MIDETQMTARERSLRILLDLLKQVEDGYETLAADHNTFDLGIPCTKCGRTDGWTCECVYHTAASETKQIGRVALRRLRELVHDSLQLATALGASELVGGEKA